MTLLASIFGSTLILVLNITHHSFAVRPVLAVAMAGGGGVPFRILSLKNQSLANKIRQSYHMSPYSYDINPLVLNIARIIFAKDERYQGPGTEQLNTQIVSLGLRSWTRIDSTHFQLRGVASSYGVENGRC